jgi:hypothetical protein
MCITWISPLESTVYRQISYFWLWFLAVVWGRFVS